MPTDLRLRITTCMYLYSTLYTAFCILLCTLYHVYVHCTQLSFYCCVHCTMNINLYAMLMLYKLQQYLNLFPLEWLIPLHSVIHILFAIHFSNIVNCCYSSAIQVKSRKSSRTVFILISYLNYPHLPDILIFIFILNFSLVL